METEKVHDPEDEIALLQSGYRYALALTHHREEAEDLVQESWLNLCRRYGRVESRAVLFTAVRHLFIDGRRRRKVVSFEPVEAEEAAAFADEPGEEPGLAGDVSELLGVLRPVEREMIFLHYYQGHTAEEIGAMTGQPRGTVLSLLHRSIAKLRQAVKKGGVAFPGNQMLLWFVALLAMTHPHRF